MPNRRSSKRNFVKKLRLRAKVLEDLAPKNYQSLIKTRFLVGWINTHTSETKSATMSISLSLSNSLRGDEDFLDKNEESFKNTHIRPVKYSLNVQFQGRSNFLNDNFPWHFSALQMENQISDMIILKSQILLFRIFFSSICRASFFKRRYISFCEWWQ